MNNISNLKHWEYKNHFLILLFFIFSLGTHNDLFAQKYGNALGVTVANGNIFRSVGITYQQRVFNNVTIEGILETDFRHNTLCHAIAELHSPIISKRLNYYLGAGFSLGNEQSSDLNNAGIEVATYGNSTFGTDLIAGLEITLLKYNLSIAYKPNFNIVGRENWYQGEVGISARAVIMSGATYDKKRRIKKRTKKKKARIELRAEREAKRVENRQIIISKLKK